MNRIDAYKATELQRLAHRIKLAGYCRELGKDELKNLLLELFDDDRRRGDGNVLAALAEVKGGGALAVAKSPVAIQADKSGASAAMLAKPLRGLFRPEALNYEITMSDDYASLDAALAALAVTFKIPTGYGRQELLRRLEHEARIVPIYLKLDDLAARFRGYLDEAMAGARRFDALAWSGDVCLLAYIGTRWFFVLRRSNESPAFRIQHIRPSLVYEQFCQAVSPPIAKRAEQSATLSRSNAPVLAQWPKTRGAMPSSVVQMLLDILSANDTTGVNGVLARSDAFHAEVVKFFASSAVATLDQTVNIYATVTATAVDEMLAWRPGYTKTIKGILAAMRRPDTNCAGVFKNWSARSLLLVIEMPPGSRLFIPDYTVMERKIPSGSFPVNTALVLPPVDSKFVLEAPPARHAVRNREDDTKPDMDVYVLRVRLVV
ncbi:hypothetical protein [Medusavirus stheno T3]|uniref:Uncharacterized protein n=1 Tax=Medusavirus stheno T3 TaxID=3069717 RepID=A0A7S7YFK1_9VIRU|nr:hypothetical protein QKU73_gp004 [Acanthamoeba castellanii medusavirus]QPB44185.1 hypothetical protein [Medusavirus stheno T3]